MFICLSGIWFWLSKSSFFCLFCCFTSQVNSYGHGGTVSSPNHTFSWASLNKLELRAHTFACNWQQSFLNDSAEGRRMTVEIISWSISTKEWDQAGIELLTPGSAVRLASVTRHVTNCTTQPSSKSSYIYCNIRLAPVWNIDLPELLKISFQILPHLFVSSYNRHMTNFLRKNIIVINIKVLAWNMKISDISIFILEKFYQKCVNW